MSRKDDDKDGNKQKRPTGAHETIIHGRPEAPLHIRLDNDYLRIDVYHHNAEDGGPGVLTKLESLEALLLNIQQDERKDYKLTREEARKLDVATNAIKTRIEAFIAKHADDITPAEQAEVDADFAMLDALGKDPANPIPEPTV